jgi:CBS domain-containing protein
MDSENGRSLLFAIADTIRDGSTWPTITVRDLLQWFGARRRGFWVVEQIREDLAEVGLRTNPDFESAYIDAPIEFLLESANPAVVQDAPSEDQDGNDRVVEVSSSSDVSARPFYGDPTYRLSKLPAANRVPISVKPDASLGEAVTLLLQHDFSQLPVMTSERDVKGTVSWMSIGGRLALAVC